MKKITEFLKRLKPSKRKIVQLYLALLFNANLKGFVSGRIYSNDGKVWCAPGINCYSCPGAVGACPLGSLQGSFSADRSTLFYVGGILLLYAILFGRMICGWACPFGLIEELLYKIKSPKLKKNPVTRVLSFCKYVVLVFFVFIVPITYAFRDFPLPTFCKYICPIGTIEGGLGLLSNKFNEHYLALLGPLFTWKFILMISIVVGSIFIFRLFCRFLCPLGGFYGLFNRFSVFGVKVDESKCTHCNLCISHCKVDIRHVGDQECIFCGECIDVCPTKAISWKGPKILIRDNDIPADLPEEEKQARKAKIAKKNFAIRAVICTLALCLLGGMIVYYWNTTPPLTSPTVPTEPSGPVDQLTVGNQVGNLLFSQELEIINGDGVTGEKLDPSKTGKVTVINFWGTWCSPCKAELPFFDQIASEYEDVTVVTVHSFRQRDTAPKYIRENYADSKIIFTQDYHAQNGYYNLLGGTGTWPMTVILDARGVVTDVVVTPLHYEELKVLVDKALNVEAPTIPEGNQVGNQLFRQELEIINGDGVSGEKLDPSKTGKITIINFWGTWCSPCKAELPFFDQIASEYEDVAVITVHSFRQRDTAPKYIRENYADSKIIFTQDYHAQNGYYNLLGGTGTWPMTIVLDENGIVTHVIVTPLHYEELQAIVEELKNK